MSGILHALELNAAREEELHRLVGVEDAPEGAIREEQQRIHEE